MDTFIKTNPLIVWLNEFWSLELHCNEVTLLNRSYLALDLHVNKTYEIRYLTTIQTKGGDLRLRNRSKLWESRRSYLCKNSNAKKYAENRYQLAWTFINEKVPWNEQEVKISNITRRFINNSFHGQTKCGNAGTRFVL